MDTRERTLLKRQEVLGGYDPSQYEAERIWATARDGTQGADLAGLRAAVCVRDGTAPMLLYGYGSYGISLSPTFSSSRLSLLDRGVIYAIAYIRGGGELGEQWREQGRMMQKMNTFTDFIDCAEHLIARTLHVAGPAGDPGRQRRRAAGGRRRQHAPEPVPRGGRAGARSWTS